MKKINGVQVAPKLDAEFMVSIFSTETLRKMGAEIDNALHRNWKASRPKDDKQAQEFSRLLSLHVEINRALHLKHEPPLPMVQLALEKDAEDFLLEEVIKILGEMEDDDDEKPS